MSEDVLRVAHHEAGHAVAVVALRVSLRSASIEGTEASLGDTFTRGFERANLDMAYTLDHRVRAELQRHIIVSYAGGLAERRYLGHDISLPTVCTATHEELPPFLPTPGADHDAHAIGNMAYRLGEGDADEAGYWSALLAYRALRLVQNPMHWHAIAMLAAQLVTHRRLSGPRVRQLVREGWQDYGRSSSRGVFARQRAAVTQP